MVILKFFLCIKAMFLRCVKGNVLKGNIYIIQLTHQNIGSDI